MKKILNIFFVTLGVIFFVLILIGMYVYIADPYNLKPLFMNTVAETEIHTTASTTVDITEDKKPVLNEAQEAALETVGINPAAVPTEVTPEQEACAIEALGAERVAEIKAGAAPTPADIFAVRGCL